MKIIRNCENCGCQPDDVEFPYPSNRERTEWQVYCGCCNNGPTAYGFSAEDAVNSWNEGRVVFDCTFCKRVYENADDREANPCDCPGELEWQEYRKKWEARLEKQDRKTRDS